MVCLSFLFGFWFGKDFRVALEVNARPPDVEGDHLLGELHVTIAKSAYQLSLIHI